MSNLALLPPTAHCAVADRVEPYGLVAGSIHGACTTLSLDKSGRHVAAGYERGALFVWDPVSYTHLTLPTTPYV